MQTVLLKKRIILATLATLLFSGLIKAQATDALGTYTPYTLFGIGELSTPGTSLNRSLGGAGSAIRDKRFINFLNPASLTQRDTMSFMLDFGIDQKNIYSSDANTSSAFNTFNIHHLVVSLPIYKKSAFMIGISPVSNVGYKFEVKESDPEMIEEFGDLVYRKYGTGSLSKAFLGVALQLNKHFSAGVEAGYIFGSINRHSDILFNTNPTFRSINSGWDYVINGWGFKLGLQYFGKLGNGYDFSIGSTYSFKTNISGDVTRYGKTQSNSGIVDTVLFEKNLISSTEIPSEFNLGVSISKSEKWIFAADVLFQNWSNFSFPESTSGIDYSTGNRSKYMLGFEYTPNRYDLRYYMKRVSYRGGLYYENSYINFGDKNIKSTGLTLGLNFPIHQLNNAVGITLDVGQRGSIKNNLVKENYLMFIFNINLHDIWFQKFRYD